MSMLYHGISVIIAFKNGEIKEHCTDFCNEIRVDLCEKKELFKSVSDWDGFSDEVFSAFHTPYDDIGDASWDEYAAIPLEDFVYEISSEDVKNIYSVVLITNHDNDWGPRKLDWKKITLNPYVISTGSYELEADVDLDGCEMSYALENIIPEVKNFKKIKSSIKKIKNDDLSDGVFTYFLFDEDNKRCQSMASVDYWVDNDDVCITGYLGEDTCVEIPEYIDGKPVTVIYKMSCGKNLKSIHFKNSENKMHVEPDAFKYCESIEEMIVDVPEKIYFIDGALSCCKKLISDGFVIIDGFLFDDIEKNKRKVLEIPEGVKKIGYGIYNQCKNIEEIVLPKSLITVVSHGFEYCSSLKKITINGKTKFEDYSLYGCTELEEIVVNGEINIDWSSNESIFSTSPKLKGTDDFFISGSNFFSYSGEKEIYSIPEGVEVIGPSAFKDNRKLKKVNLPDSVKCICSRAFDGCCSLEEINFPEGLVSIGHYAFNGCGLKKVVFNKNLERIGNSAFEYCHNLSEVNISPATVCESKAFNGCNTKELSREDGLVVINGVAYDYYYSKNAKFYNTPDDISRVVLSGDVESITSYFFNSPGDTLDEFIMTNAVKKMPTGAFFLSGIKLFKVLDSVTGETVFETTEFKGKSNTLLCNSGKFERFCELIEKGDYETIRAEFNQKTINKNKTSTVKKAEKMVAPIAENETVAPVWVDPFPEDADVDDFDAQFRKEWLEKYGECITENPIIEIKDKTFVFAGFGAVPASYMEQEDPTVAEVVKRGGLYRSKISGKTDYLIVNPAMAGDSKIKAAIEQRNKGKAIQIVLIEVLQDFLNGKISEQKIVNKSDVDKTAQVSDGQKTIEKSASTQKKKTAKITVKCNFPEYEVKDSRKKFLKKSPGLRKPVHPNGCDIRFVNVYDRYLNAEEREFAKLIEATYTDDEKSKLKQTLISKALEIADLFAVEDGKFDAENDRSAMIKSGYMKSIYQLHALRSFAWTLTKWVKDKNKNIADITIDELIALAEFIENAGGANYNASTSSDTTFCASLRPKLELGRIYIGTSGWILVPKVQEGDECFSGTSGVVPISIFALRNDLLTLSPAIDTIFNYLKVEDDGQSESTLSDILVAWAAFAFASREPFAVVKGPEKVLLENSVEIPEEVPVKLIEPDKNGCYVHNGILFAIRESKCNLNDLKITDGVERILFDGRKLGCVVYGEHPDFCFLHNIKKLTLPGTIKSIGHLYECTAKEVVFGDGIETISGGAFRVNKNLEKVTFPVTIREFGEDAFECCAQLENLVIRASSVKVKKGAFGSCKNLKTVTFSGIVEEIGAEAFRWSENLKQVLFWDPVEEIAEEAFYGCENLEEVIFKSSLKRIRKGAFKYCHNIKRITIPASVEEIGEGAFDSVYGLEGPDSYHYKYGGQKFDFVFEVYKDSYAEKYAKAKGWYHTVILSEEQKVQIKAREEALRRAEQERIAEAKRREELRKLREEEERRRREAEERAKRVAHYRELLEEEKILLQTIEENKGLFGEKARKRKEAKARLEEVRKELEEYKDLEE